jgi:hypothetical protein
MKGFLPASNRAPSPSGGLPTPRPTDPEIFWVQIVWVQIVPSPPLERLGLDWSGGRGGG